MSQSVKAVSTELFTARPYQHLQQQDREIFPSAISEAVYFASCSSCQVRIFGKKNEDGVTEINVLLQALYPLMNIRYSLLPRPAVRTSDSLAEILCNCGSFPKFYKDFERNDILPQPSLTFDTVVWGYLTLDYVRRVVPLMRSDPLVGTVPLIGLWFRSGQQISSGGTKNRQGRQQWWEKTLCSGTVRAAIAHFLESTDENIGKKVGHTQRTGNPTYMALVFPPENYHFGNEHPAKATAVEFSAHEEYGNATFECRFSMQNKNGTYDISAVDRYGSRGTVKSTKHNSLVIRASCSEQSDDRPCNGNSHVDDDNSSDSCTDEVPVPSGNCHDDRVKEGTIYERTSTSELGCIQFLMEEVTPMPKSMPPEPRSEPSLPNKISEGKTEDLDAVQSQHSHDQIKAAENPSQNDDYYFNTDCATKTASDNQQEKLDRWLPSRFSDEVSVHDDRSEASSSISDRSSDEALMNPPSIPELSMVDQQASNNGDESEDERWLPSGVGSQQELHGNQVSKHSDAKYRSKYMPQSIEISLFPGEHNALNDDNNTFGGDKSYHKSRYEDSITSMSTFVHNGGTPKNGLRDHQQKNEDLLTPRIQDYEETPLPQAPPSPYPSSDQSTSIWGSSPSPHGNNLSCSHNDDQLVHTPLRTCGLRNAYSNNFGNASQETSKRSPVGERLEEVKNTLRRSRAEAGQKLANLTTSAGT